MSNAYEELYNKIKTLNKQWFYDKTEITSLINGKANVNHAHTDKEDAIEFITGTTTSSGNVLGGTSTKLNSLQNGTKILYKTPAQSSTDINTAYLQLTLANGTTSNNYLCDATGGFLMTKEIPANTVLLLVYVTSFQSRWQIISRSNDATTNSSGLMSKTDKTKLDGLNNFSGSYNDLTDKPTIPDVSGYLQISDVKDNLTSTDTNKPLSAKQGKELKALIDNKEDNIYRIVGTGTQIGTLFPNRVELQGTFPFDSVNGKIIIYVVPDISSLSKDLLLDLQGTYPSGSTTKFNIRKSNDAPISIGEIQTGDELLLFYDNSRWRLIGNSSISGKADSNHQHGTVTNDGKVTTNADVASEDYIIISDVSDSNKIKRTLSVLTSHIKDSTAYANIGSSANATQATINSNINTALGNKANATHTHSPSQVSSGISSNDWLLSYMQGDGSTQEYFNQSVNYEIDNIWNEFSSVYNAFNDYELVSLKTDDISQLTSNTEYYPSAKGVADYIDYIIPLTNLSDFNDDLVADNLTTNDATKVLSAKQGMTLKSLVDKKQDIIKSITVTNDGRLYLLTQVPRYITYSTTKSMLTYENDYADISITVTDENQEIIEGAEVQFYIIFATGSSSPTRYLYTDNTGTCTTRVFSEELSTSNQINIKYGEYISRYNIGRQPNLELIDDYDTPS